MLRSCVRRFVGNAGIVEVHDGTTIAVKAETHNHPSGVEPFGGANTGVGGVIRDVLGMRPPPDRRHRHVVFRSGRPADPTQLPDGCCIRGASASGVVDGVADYGNKIGLPTVAGAVLYDPAYTANPLVFAGCIGIADRPPLHDGPHAGDRVVVLGGATGRDGIRGATFSSATMDATTGEVAGASVQIGDPIVEKLLIDVLARRRGLYSAITDCGAGGLSSAVGEMAEGIGADVELDLVPLKYPGLEPWEIWLSRGPGAHGRLRSPTRLAELPNAADGTGWTWPTSASSPARPSRRAPRRHVVAASRHQFLHDGRPQRAMVAELPAPEAERRGRRAGQRPDVATLLALLAHPNIASKASIIRRYDHEILGSTVVRPLDRSSRDGHADGVVIADPADSGRHRDRHRRQPVVSATSTPSAWPSPSSTRRSATSSPSAPTPTGSLARQLLVGRPTSALDARRTRRRRRRLLRSADRTTGRRSSSGKDSLNNEYLGTDGQRHAVPPTLVITAIAHVPDADAASPPISSERRQRRRPGRSTRTRVRRHHLDKVQTPPTERRCRAGTRSRRPERYRRLHRAIRSGVVRACHDVSEGGLAVALAEMCIAGRLGARIDHAPPPRPGDGAVQRVDRPARRRGRTRRRRRVRRSDGRRRTRPRHRHRDRRTRLRRAPARSRSTTWSTAFTGAFTGRSNRDARARHRASPGRGRTATATSSTHSALAGAGARTSCWRPNSSTIRSSSPSARLARGGRRLQLRRLARRRTNAGPRSRPSGSARSCATFVAAGRPLIGICNGFQVLTRAGLLPWRTRPQRRRHVRLPLGRAGTGHRLGVRVDPRSRRHDPLPDRPRRGPLRPPRSGRARRGGTGRAALRRLEPQRVGRRHRRCV